MSQKTPFPKLTWMSVIRIAAPVALLTLAMPLVDAVAITAIGRMGDSALIGGVAATNVVMNLIFASMNFLRLSTIGLIAQARNRQDSAEIAAITLRALLLAAVGGAIVLALSAFLGELSFRLLALEGPLFDAASTYFSIRIWSAPLHLINLVLLGWLLGCGKVSTSILFQLSGSALFILLSLLFVLLWEWEVFGLGIAAIISELAICLLGVKAFIRHYSKFFPLALNMLTLQSMYPLLRVNSDILIRTLLLLLVIASFTREGARLGTDILAANALLISFFHLSGGFLNGPATAGQLLVAEAVGAKNRIAFFRILRLVFGIGGILSAVLVLIFALCIDAALLLMTSDTSVAALASTYRWWVVFIPLLGMAAFLFDGIFLGALWSRDARNMMILSVGLFFLCWIILVPIFGNHGLWASFAIFLAMRGLTLYARLTAMVRTTFGN